MPFANNKTISLRMQVVKIFKNSYSKLTILNWWGTFGSLRLGPTSPEPGSGSGCIQGFDTCAKPGLFLFFVKHHVCTDISI